MAEPNLPSIEQRMETLLRNIAEELRPCKACGAQLAMVRHANGRLAPYTMAGVNHFITCPRADQFRRKNAACKGDAQ